MALFRFLCIFFCLLLNYPVLAQNNSIQRMLAKRYGQAMPWGKGYIVKTKIYYGFANSAGSIILPVNHYRFDTLLSDRAALYGYNGCTLIDESGTQLINGGAYRTVNRKKRVLAYRNQDNTETLCTDNGIAITSEAFYKSSPKDALLTLSRFDGKETLFGIITASGDTLRRPEYQSVSHGKKLYACMRHDTAFVFHRNGKLLFAKSAVHGCEVLENEFIVLQKYGMSALVNRQGRLITGFRYLKIEALNYADTVVMVDKRSQKLGGMSSPNYFMVGNHVYGLIDSSGKEILPLIYDGIYMSRKGWLIVRKEGYGKEELLDPKFNEVLQTESYDLHFINARYVRAEYDSYGDNSETRIYDMVLKRFTNKSFPEKEDDYYRDDTPWVDYYKDKYNNHYFPDSIIINETGTTLLKKNGRWGVRALSGDTILPFIYDTISQYGYYSVGRDHKFGALDWEGSLATPVELPDFPRSILAADSLVFVGDKQVEYSYKGWRIQAVDPAKTSSVNRYLQVVSGIIWSDGKNKVPRGIYNRNMKRLANMPYPPPEYHPRVTYNGIVAIQDSATKLVTVIDSMGRRLGPWITAPKSLVVAGEYALALSDTGKADILFRFKDGINVYDTVWVEASRKKKILYPIWNQYQRPETWPWSDPLTFEKKKSGRGALYWHKALLIPNSEKLKANAELAAIGIGDKWAVYDWDGKQVLPAEYDSINVKENKYYTLTKNGKYKVYDAGQKKLHEASYDSLVNLGSLYNRFFIGYQQGLAEFVDADGHVISGGWKSVTNRGYYILGGIPAKQNGKSCVLYPTLVDSLEAELVEEEMPEVDKEEYMSFSLALLTKNGLQGVYDKVEKRWIVPANYGAVEGLGGYFIARSYTPEVSTLFTDKGIKLFSIDGIYYRPSMINRTQFQMGGTYEGPIVNCRGVVIVPDTFKYINTLQKPGKPLYYAWTKQEKYMVIDTSGNVLIPAILDHVDEWPIHKEYHKVWMDDNVGLVGPDGKLIANCIYESISDGRSKEREQYYNWYPVEKNKIVVVQNPYFVVTKGTREKFKWGVIDFKGRSTVPCMYDSIMYIQNSIVVVAKKGNYWGLVTVNNKPITNFIYDSIDEYGSLEFRRGKLHGYLSEDGKEQLIGGEN